MIEAFFEAHKNRPSEKVAKLFAVTKKNELIKMAKQTILSYRDLAATVAGCGSIGYHHVSGHFDPDVSHLWALSEDRKMTPELLRKLGKQLKEESSRVTFNVFVSKDLKAWHLFFHTTRGINGFENGKHGPHVHFVNHLRKLSLLDLLRQFPKVPGGNPVHITIR